MYGVAQLVVERYSSMTLPAFVTQRIFSPLNMTSSYYSFAESNATGRMSESWAYFGRRIPHWLNDSDLGLIAGAGGIMSSAVDMVRWARVLVRATNGTAVGIPEDVIQTCMSAHSLVETGHTYGYGWEQQDFQGIPVIFSSGLRCGCMLTGLADRLARGWCPRRHLAGHGRAVT
jgi:CubicO group peptidase (beta-lactamase class C family)